MFTRSPIFWIFSGSAWPVKVAIIIIVPIALVIGAINTYPWAILLLIPSIVTLLAGKPAAAIQQACLVVLPPTLLALAHQLGLTVHRAAQSHTLPDLDFAQIALHIPAHLLYYSAPGGEPLQWAGRAAALLGLLLSVRLLPWGFAASLLARSPHLRLVEDPALGTACWHGWRELHKDAKPGWPKPGNSPGILIGKLDRKIITLYPRAPVIVNHHAVVLGSSGAGKSTGYVLPNIYAAAQAGQSIVVTDPKGEIVKQTGTWLESQGYTIQIFAPGQPIGHAWNPLLEARNETELDLLAQALLQSDVGKSDPFFRAAEQYLLRLYLHAVREHPDLRDDERNLLTVLSRLEALKPEALTAFVGRSGSQVAIDTLKVLQTRCGKFDPALGTAAKLSGLRKAALNVCSTDGAMIDLAAIRQRKTALFCVLPVGTNAFAPLLAAFYALLFVRLMGAPAEAYAHGVRLLLDEFANLGAIPGFSAQLAVARGYGVSISIMLQSIDQLDAIYGPMEAKVIINNCATMLVLGINDLASSTYISRLLGDTAARQQRDRHVQDSLVAHRERVEDTIRRALLSPDEVRRLSAQGDGIAIAGPYTVRFNRLDFYRERLYREISCVPFVPPPLDPVNAPPIVAAPPTSEEVDCKSDWF